MDSFSSHKTLFLFLSDLKRDFGNINLCNSGLISLLIDFSSLVPFIFDSLLGDKSKRFNGIYLFSIFKSFENDSSLDLSFSSDFLKSN